MRKLLLCPPDYYGIEYEINPWMHRADNAVPEIAARQWRGLREKLESLGCEVKIIEPVEKLPDMVFTANAGIVLGNRFIRSNFRFAERRGEEHYYDRWFESHGYKIVHLPGELFFEGEGDALFCGEILFCGYRFRSDIRAHQHLAELLKCLVISVELVEDRYYHLDTCFCPLPGGAAIWFPGAFDSYGQSAIRQHLNDLIEVAPEEATHFACNAIVLDKDIILPESTPRLCAELSRRGFQTHPLAMTEFLKAGGACKCLSLLLPQRQ
jgi:N-dimethylarginine dimethylaminohydrolase